MAIRHSTPADNSFTPAGKAAWDAGHDGDASDIAFLPSGTGAIAETVQDALRLFVHTSQYSSNANYVTARDALTGTVGLKNLSVSGGVGSVQFTDGVNPAASTWQVHMSASGGQNSFTMDAYGAENVILGRTALGTAASPSQLLTNQMMMNVACRGYHSGGAFTTLSRAGMTYNAAEDWTSTAQGTHINWYVTTIAAASATTKMTLHDDGTLVLGLTGSSPLTKNAVGGTIQVNGQASIIDADLPRIYWSRNGTIKAYFAIGNGTSISGSAAAGDLIIRAEQALWLRVNGDSAGMTLDTAGSAIFGGSIKTGILTGSVAAGIWRCGGSNPVSPTSPNRTVSLDINGTIYYLHAKTTND